jgi:2'-5' RNA ligase
MDKIRSFIAIELPLSLRQELGRIQARLRVDKPRIKWVDPDGIHLTLKFLGNVEAARIDGITQAVAESARRVHPIQLNIQELGAFPSLKRVQVVWVGLGGELDKLSRLYQLLEAGLAGLGFPPEQRHFSPHLTLARLGNEASPEERQLFGQLITDTRLESDYSFKADALSLMRSQLTGSGAIYSRISSAMLGKGPLS